MTWLKGKRIDEHKLLRAVYDLKHDYGYKDVLRHARGLFEALDETNYKPIELEKYERVMLGADALWQSVSFGNGVFVSNDVMTSSDGINWDLHPVSAHENRSGGTFRQQT